MISTGPTSDLGLRSRGEQVNAGPAKKPGWYVDYFDLDFWKLSECGNAAERTAAEVSYLCRTLERISPGPRVVDLGCGVGDRAIALAQAGFEVTAIDVSARVVEEARRRAAKAGTVVRCHVFDPVSGGAWPFSAVDAVVCMHAFGWGSDAFQLRLLRRIHRQLIEDGVLILERSPFWLDRRNFPGANGSSESHPSLESKYDPVTGRLKGRMVFFKDNGDQSSTYDVRQYSLVELASLVRSAGFAVEQIDAELSPGRAAMSKSGRAQVVARCLPLPPESLAVADWGTQAQSQIDLRYAPDETEWLDPRPDELWQELIASTPHHGSDLAANYPVHDPYGGERGAEVVAQHFDCALSPTQVTFAAGVSAFMPCLGDLADGGAIAAPELVHGDLEAWAASRGVEVRIFCAEDLLGLRAALETNHPALLHLDRPTFTGRFLPLAELEDLIAYASGSGTIVLIDESAAPYPGPAQSSVRLVNRVDNLVVLRGFTKAYSLGGLRAGFAVASPAVAPRIRQLVPPLQIGELAFHAALRLLRAGDVFGRLRARIYAVKPEVAHLLTRCGFDVIDGHPSFPWIAIENQGGTGERVLAECGVRCLRPASPPTVAKPPGVVRVTIPISDERIELLNTLLSRGLVQTDR